MNRIPLAIVTAGGLGLIALQLWIRPALGSAAANEFVGSSPNFIVGATFPFSILLSPQWWTRRQAHSLFLVWCLGSLVALVLFEIGWSAHIGRPLDWNDILASFLGVTTAFVAYWHWLRRRLTFRAD